jgi:cytochrome c-type biogenesis protein CcmH/NrfG
VGVAASFVAVPVWHRALAYGRGHNRLALAGAFLATFAAAAGIIYFAIGSRHGLTAEGSVPAMPAVTAASANTSAKSMDAAISGLEARLARDGGSADDWTLLAKAYDFLGRPDDASRARAHIASPAGGVGQMNVAALVAGATAADAGDMVAAQASPGAAASPAPTLAQLQRRVKDNPRDTPGWLALADLERAQHEDRAARDALAKVIALHGMTAQSWADYADVLAALGGGTLTGDAGRAIDSALALDPANLKALWLKASQEHEQRHFTIALVWWKTLRAALPPESPDVRIIDGNIAEDTTLAGGTPAAATAGAGTPPASAPGAAGVSGSISIDTRLAARVQRDATLFIYAKAADSPGPPLAVLRTTVGAWPVSFHLDDSMAMIPSRRLSQFDKVVVEARISRSGQATPGTGDLYVTSPVLRPAAGLKLALVIDHEIG